MEKSIPEYAWCKKNPEGQDCWWQGLNEESVKRFLGSIKIAETRFISDIDMITRINRSKEVERLYNEQEKVISYLGRISEFDNYQFIPTKCLCAPIEWYKAAELVCREEMEYCTRNNINAVRNLGENAYRVYVLRNDLTPKEKIANTHPRHRQEPRPQGVTPQKQTAGGPYNLQHPQQWVLEVLFYIHLRNRKSSATHQARGGGASKASDGGEKNTWRNLADCL